MRVRRSAPVGKAEAQMKAKAFIGTSGFTYLHWWGGVFYPQELPQRKWLEFYCESFDTVELNVSFYRVPSQKTFEGWYRRTPRDFGFATKGTRLITHVKKLGDIKETLQFFLQRVGVLREKLSVILWQLPPALRMNERKFEEFCKLLSSLSNSSLRHAFEFRHKSWFCPTIYEMLREYNYSLCIAHSSRFPFEEVVTADFVYLRFHGGERLYGSEYSDEELEEWAAKAEGWLGENRDIYAYFNNDAHGFAVQNALKLRELIRQKDR